MKHKNFLKIFFNILPYFVIFGFSLLGCYLLFYKGTNLGDDYFFHIPNIYEQYKTILEGHSLSYISGYIGMGLGVGNRLFYSPLSQFCVVIMALIIKIFNGSVLQAYKIVLFLSVFVSGIFMYRFAMHFTSKNKIASIIAATVFVIYPYRLFDAFCRLAFAEAFAFIFLPLFFMGLYDIVHFKDKINPLSFVEIILGGSLLYLSHNITAFYAFIIGIIYLLSNIHKIIPLMKNKKYLIFCCVSIFLLIGMCSIALFSQFELMATNIYTISDSKSMWTDTKSILNPVKQYFEYSGFLNIVWLKSAYGNILTTSSLYLDICTFLGACMVFVLVDIALSEFKKLKFFSHLISCVIYGIIVFIFAHRVEYYFSCIIFLFLYFFILLINKFQMNVDVGDQKIYKNHLFWFSVSLIFILLFTMQSEGVWTHAPKIFRNIQFPWRLWVFVQLFAAILCGLIAQHINYSKIGLSVLSVLVGLLMIYNQPLLEKRLGYENNYESNYLTSIDDSILDYGAALGHNKEYIPIIFLQNDYHSKYSNSLYNSVKNKIRYDSFNVKDYSLDPIFLTGNGSITINSRFAPVYKMEITVSENNSLIQMPLLYYPGYQIKVTSQNKEFNVESINIDGLIAFRLPAGTYKVETDYIGTPLKIFSEVYFSFSFSITMAILYSVVVIKYNDRKKKSFKIARKKIRQYS